MSSTGIGTGIGEGLHAIAANLRQRDAQKQHQRQQEADHLSKQLDAIALNRAQLKQELGMIPQGTPDYISKAGELQKTEEIMQQSTQALHALGANDPSWLITHLKGWLGRKQPQQAAPYVQGATQTPDVLNAAAPLPDFSKTDAGIRHAAGLQQELGLSNMEAMAKKQKEIQDAQDIATEAWAKKNGIPDDQIADLKALHAGIPATLLAKEKVAPKPLTKNFNSATGGLLSIDNPNTGESWHAGNIDKAPPAVKDEWTAIQKQEQDQVAAKKAEEEAKAAELEKRQRIAFQDALAQQAQSFQNSLDIKDYGEARKQISDADKDLQGAIDRQKTMDQNLKSALKGDQQAMLSLVANHIGMTLGAQKGARINQAVWNEAVASAPWLSTVAAKWSKDGYLSGVTLAPEQMQSMVNLAKEKVGILKEHKGRLDEQYKDVLSLNKATPGDLKEKTKPTASSVDDEIINAIKPKTATPKKK